MEDPGAMRTGCAPPRRGYRAATPPATLEPRLRRRASARRPLTGCTASCRAAQGGPEPRQAIVTAMPTRRRRRLGRSVSEGRARSGRDSLRRHHLQQATMTGIQGSIQSGRSHRRIGSVAMAAIGTFPSLPPAETSDSFCQLRSFTGDGRIRLRMPEWGGKRTVLDLI